MSVEHKEGRLGRSDRDGLTMSPADCRALANRVATLCLETVRQWRDLGAGLVERTARQLLTPETSGRRKSRHEFRPAMAGDGVVLEPRLLLTTKRTGVFYMHHTKPGLAYANQQPPLFSPGAPRPAVSTYPRGQGIATQVARGGQSVIVATREGHFKISLTQFIPTAGSGISQTSSTTNVPGTQTPIQGEIPGSGVVQPIGTVRAYAMPRGRVGIIVDGTTTQSELDISPLPFPQRKGYAHSFAYGQTTQSHVLNVGQITVNSGQISAILGYHTANLSGPLTISGGATVDRLAFNALLPGASITTGGDLNTLDVLNQANLDGGTGITIGRDLNLLNVGQDLNLSNGASLNIGRFLGTTPQPPKGTATGSNLLAQNQALVGTNSSTSVVPSLSGYVQGDINIATGSAINIVGGIANSSVSNSATATLNPSVFLVNGFINAPDANQINIPNLAEIPLSTTQSVQAFSNVFSITFTPTGFPSPITVNFNLVARNGSNNPQFVDLSRFQT